MTSVFCVAKKKILGRRQSNNKRPDSALAGAHLKDAITMLQFSSNSLT
jgi:hypothetical protein